MSTDILKENAGKTIVAVLAIAAAIFIGWQGVMAVPIQIGALVDGLGMSERDSGLLGTIEITTVALVTMLLAARIGLWSKPRVAIAGLVLVIGGQLLTVVAPGYLLLTICRLSVGVGAGLIYGAACSCIAGIQEGDRIFAWGMGLGQIALAGLLFSLPFAQSFGVVAGVFVTLAVTAGVFGVMLPRVPDGREIVSDTSDAEARVSLSMIVLFFAALTLFNIAIGMLWGFVERRADELQMDPAQLGLILAALPIGGIVGSMTAGFIGGKFGRLRPLAGALLACTLACFTVSAVSVDVALILAILVLGVCELFVVAFMIGTASTMDTAGRYSTLAGGATLLTYGFGPGIGGLLSHWGLSASAICFASGLFCLAAAAIAIPVGISLDGREEAAA